MNVQKTFLKAASLTVGLSSLFALNASAFDARVNQVPNNMWGCALCHVNPGGAGPRTVFGEDVFMFARDGINMNWGEVCNLDSDGDGATNGTELGDPECAWGIGAENPDAMVTDPNDPASGAVMTGIPSMAGEEMAGEEMAGEEMAGDAMTTEDGEASSDEGCTQTSSRSPLLIWFILASFFMIRRQQKTAA